MTDLAPKYNPNEVEKGRYQEWLDEDLFKPSGDKKAHPYSIVIPPPNVTGKLHLGHAWDTAIQDTLIRFKRMEGYDTLYLPGMDHAGIATQAKVEAKLRKQGKDRHEMGREVGESYASPYVERAGHAAPGGFFLSGRGVLPQAFHLPGVDEREAGLS